MIIINDGHMFPSGNKLYSLQQNEAAAPMFLPVPAGELTQMCLQLHNHLFESTQWKSCAQVQCLSSSHRNDFLTSHWAPPGLRRGLSQDRNPESSCNNKCKGKEFSHGEKDLNNILKKAANTQKYVWSNFPISAHRGIIKGMKSIPSSLLEARSEMKKHV